MQDLDGVADLVEDLIAVGTNDLHSSSSGADFGASDGVFHHDSDGALDGINHVGGCLRTALFEIIPDSPQI